LPSSVEARRISASEARSAYERPPSAASSPLTWCVALRNDLTGSIFRCFAASSAASGGGSTAGEDVPQPMALKTANVFDHQQLAQLKAWPCRWV
jgi:hypothetical protein